MKIIFLDFDGVLNSHEWFAKSPDNDWGWNQLDPECVERVNRIIEATGAVVVVSSTWRLMYPSRVALQEGLAMRGFRGTVIGLTPDFPGKPRGDQIRWWLETQCLREPLESYVVLDDDSDMTTVAQRLVKTSMKTGITDADVELAVRHLSNPVG